jgi:hypothetical protein
MLAFYTTIGQHYDAAQFTGEKQIQSPFGPT